SLSPSAGAPPWSPRQKGQPMAKVILAIAFDEDGAPQRVSADPGPMTLEQRESYESLYRAYKSEKDAFWHWFDLRNRFRGRRGPDRIAVERNEHWAQVADQTERLFREAVH